MPRVCYTDKNMRRDIISWFDKRVRCFLYYYPIDHFDKADKEQWCNLNTIAGCRYHGWLTLSDRFRGELWTYKTDKHKMILQMQICSKQLMFKEQFCKLQKELKRFRKYCYRNQVRLLPEDFIIF